MTSHPTIPLVRRAVLPVCIALTAIGTAAPAALAADSLSCEKFLVYTEFVTVEHMDNGEEGISVGDTRHGHIRYTNANGEEVGRLVFHSVFSPGAKDGEYMLLAVGKALFPEGTISYTVAAPAPEQGAQTPAADEIVASVTGGTGVFFRATGAARFFNDEDGKRVSEYDIICPER